MTCTDCFILEDSSATEWIIKYWVLKRGKKLSLERESEKSVIHSLSKRKHFLWTQMDQYSSLVFKVLLALTQLKIKTKIIRWDILSVCNTSEKNCHTKAFAGLMVWKFIKGLNSTSIKTRMKWHNFVPQKFLYYI